ncbi:hypothetical protein HY386_02520 [Candidatus Daviesbacteria bacterium]|nr:hypothetical protein [Candidatus Daviesbacteria bacterium]
MRRLGVRKVGSGIKIKLLLTAFSLFLLFFLLKSIGSFSISKVEIKRENADCVSDMQLLEASQLIGSSVFINDRALEKKIKDSYICIGSAKLKYVFPNRFVLLVQGRKAVLDVSELPDKKTSEDILLSFTGYANSSESGNILEVDASNSAQVNNTTYDYLLDEEGVIFGKNINRQNLVKVLVDTPDPKIGQRYESRVITNLVRAKSILDSQNIYPGRLILLLDRFLIAEGMPKIVLDLRQDTDQQLASLQLILQMAKIDSENIEFIDLRFDKPVVRYAPKKK